MSRPSPYVNVLMITYNHEKYIAAAIDSVLRQKTPFAYELVIGEDGSTDGTRRIVEHYSRTYPALVRPFFRERNLGFQRNFIETLRACRGRYVALLEGDDYWLSTDKLAKQVALLDARPDCAICAGRARVFHDDGTQPEIDFPSGDRVHYRIDDLLSENVIPTCTAVFRLGLMLEIPAWLEQMPFIDWPLHVLLAQAGDIHVMPEALAAYRVHPQGVWSRMDAAGIAKGRRKFYDILAANLPQYSARLLELAAKLPA